MDPAFVFGIDSKLFLEKDEKFVDASHHDEVETVTIYKGPQKDFAHSHGDHEGHACGASCGEGDHSDHVEDGSTFIPEETLTAALASLSKESIWRVKGFVKTENGPQILNWAFTRFELTPVEAPSALSDGALLKVTVMGERGEVKRIARRRLAEALGAQMH